MSWTPRFRVLIQAVYYQKRFLFLFLTPTSVLIYTAPLLLSFFTHTQNTDFNYFHSQFTTKTNNTHTQIWSSVSSILSFLLLFLPSSSSSSSSSCQVLPLNLPNRGRSSLCLRGQWGGLMLARRFSFTLRIPTSSLLRNKTSSVQSSSLTFWVAHVS